MPKLNNQVNLSNLESVDELARFSSIINDQLFNIINGKLQMFDNIEFSTITASFPAANTQYAFTHTLGRVPQYFVAVTNSTGGVVYSGTTAFTVNQIYLKNTVITSNMVIWIF